MKKVLIISFLIFIIINLFNICYAKPISISEDTFIEKFLNNLDNFGYTNSPVDKEDNIIKFFDAKDNLICTITYNLDTLTFNIDVIFEGSSNIIDFLFKNDLFDVMSATIYGTLSNINCVSYSSSYSHFNNIVSSDSIVNYANNSDTIVYKNKTIPVSDFKDYSLYIAKDYYSTARTKSDKSSLNTFELSKKIKKSTKSNCTVNCTLKINRDYLTYNCYLNDSKNITKDNADHVKELYVGKNFSISLGAYDHYDVSNDHCIVSSSTNKNNITTLTITGNTAGTTTISLYSNDKWDIKTYYITVKDYAKIREVLIVAPSKTKYNVGENLDLSGLTITAVYSDDTIKQVTKGYTVKGYNKNKEGIQTVSIIYEGFTRKFNVKVGSSSNIVDVEETEKLPQTGDFFDLKDGLYILISTLTLLLIYIVYKSTRCKKLKNKIL